MPVLKNQKWERLAQELAQNKSATEAMKLAGYSDPRNSTRLTKKDEIRRRVEEIQGRGAERAEVSVASLLQELEAAREKASNLDQLSAAVRAIEAKARVSGLLVAKVEVSGAIEFNSDNNGVEDIADVFLTHAGSPIEQFCPVDQRDRQGLIELLERQQNELCGYLDALKARPHVARRCDINNLPADWKTLELSPSAVRRLAGNGSQRDRT